MGEPRNSPACRNAGARGKGWERPSLTWELWKAARGGPHASGVPPARPLGAGTQQVGSWGGGTPGGEASLGGEGWWGERWEEEEEEEGSRAAPGTQEAAECAPGTRPRRWGRGMPAKSTPGLVLGQGKGLASSSRVGHPPSTGIDAGLEAEQQAGSSGVCASPPCRARAALDGDGRGVGWIVPRRAFPWGARALRRPPWAGLASWSLGGKEMRPRNRLMFGC